MWISDEETETIDPDDPGGTISGQTIAGYRDYEAALSSDSDGCFVARLTVTRNWYSGESVGRGPQEDPPTEFKFKPQQPSSPSSRSTSCRSADASAVSTKPSRKTGKAQSTVEPPATGSDEACGAVPGEGTPREITTHGLSCYGAKRLALRASKDPDHGGCGVANESGTRVVLREPCVIGAFECRTLGAYETDYSRGECTDSRGQRVRFVFG